MPPSSTHTLDPRQSAGAFAAETDSSAPMSVLVVDDAPALRRAIAQLLTLEGGYAVREAGTHLEAVELLDQVDAVTTDGFFPYSEGEAVGPWGLALARLARARGKRAILVSADAALVEQARLEGIQALKKPSGILQLVAMLADSRVPVS